MQGAGAELFNRGRQPDLEKAQTWIPANQCPELPLRPPPIATWPNLTGHHGAREARAGFGRVGLQSAEPGGCDGSHGGQPGGAGPEQQGPTVMRGSAEAAGGPSTAKEVIQKDCRGTTGTQRQATGG